MSVAAVDAQVATVAESASVNLLMLQAQTQVCLMLPNCENCHCCMESAKYEANREYKFFKTHSLQASGKPTELFTAHVLDELLQ